MLESEIKEENMRMLNIEVEMLLEDDFLFDFFDVYYDHFEEFCSYKGLTKQSDEYSRREWFGEFVKDYLKVKGEECLAIDNEYIKWLLEKYKGSTEYYEFIYKICEELETENVEEVEKGLIDYYFS